MSGTGKTHIGLALGSAACQQGFRVRFTTAAALVHELIEARDDKRLLRYQKNLSRQELLIVDELGFVPLSKAGAEMLFEVLSQRYERSSTLVTSNLPFAEWTEVLGSERLTGALLDRLTHYVHILRRIPCAANCILPVYACRGCPLRSRINVDEGSAFSGESRRGERTV